MALLTQNREMRRIRAWNWTLPAWAGRLDDGRTYNTCPSAGVCKYVCYARNGTYLFPAVKAKHQANLKMVVDDLPGWIDAMNAELSHRKFQGAAIRIHDSGDFFSESYLRAWLSIIRQNADREIFFYCYTKEVILFREVVEPDPPPNFKWCFSYGGTQDRLLDPASDRVADVFPDGADILGAGFNSQEESDLLAVNGPSPVGIAANNIRHYLKIQGDRTFSEWQAEVDAEAAARRSRRPS